MAGKTRKKCRTLGRAQAVSIGPRTIGKVYPYSAYSRITREQIETAWQLVGPTIERNIDRPLWMQFAAAYLEGLNHGAGAERERAALNVAGQYW